MPSSVELHAVAVQDAEDAGAALVATDLPDLVDIFNLIICHFHCVCFPTANIGKKIRIGVGFSKHLRLSSLPSKAVAGQGEVEDKSFQKALATPHT